jgi:hypothetical protein
MHGCFVKKKKKIIIYLCAKKGAHAYILRWLFIIKIPLYCKYRTCILRSIISMLVDL